MKTMCPVLPLALLSTAACGACYAQAPDAKAEFEVVTVKPSAPPSNGMRRVGCDGGPGTKDPAMFRCTNMSLSNLITRAYGIAYYQLTGPDWLQQTMFEIQAKVPQGAAKEQLPAMILNMLNEQFKLAVHHESKEFAKYELVVAKGGPKLNESVEEPPPPADGAPPKPAPMAKDGLPELGPGHTGMAINGKRAILYYSRWTMTQFAGMIASQMAKPVTDATGLTGKYDIGLHWAPDNLRTGAANIAPPDSEPDGPTLQQALQDQLGLRLEAKKGPLDFVVVDHCEKTPAGN